MKLSTKGRYAVTAMMDIAIHDASGPVTLADISMCQGISLSYLEQLFAKLRKSGLVEGVRGPGGGYRLSRPAEEISIAAIIGAVDESSNAARCQDEDRCVTHQLWDELSDRLHGFLEGITLDEFTARPDVLEIARQQDIKYRREHEADLRKSAA
ncbi:Rrf2 family transcriptional regulator [Acidihalobacter ferrooxydans]|uniref:Fe-S cluster assembly transcriptional regulator IscR n=1 Tax=Acidihalobacter ferrooxydans TaxID=1765967 RepID=A0A1P8UFQ2_9GAMM|nr:Rrf2 family transcriptional regulator [Acidihalobacter ferrooxydans]APZ42682.1 Fe-S cluster assembly transcriptional regulator IscR [Acidihalobacter ferrooxydans]